MLVPGPIQSPKNTPQSLVKENILKTFRPQIWHAQKKLVPGPSQIQSLDHSVNEKILKTFWPQIWHYQKKLVSGPFPT